MAQKKAPPAAATRIREQFALASKPALAQAKVRDIVRQSLREAPPAEPSASSQTIQSALAWGPVVLGLMEDFDRQWDKVRSVTVEVRKDGSQTLVALTIQVEPGRQLELHSWPMPTLVLAGTCRIVIQPTYDPTRQAVVLFDSPEGGSCRLRFDGLIYAFARLVLPLEDATVREIRLARSSTYRGPNLASAEVLLDTGKSRSDARRMFVYQTAQVHRPQRQAVSIREISSDRRDTFTYVTPHMLYTYEYPRPIGK